MLLASVLQSYLDVRWILNVQLLTLPVFKPAKKPDPSGMEWSRINICDFSVWKSWRFCMRGKPEFGRAAGRQGHSPWLFIWDALVESHSFAKHFACTTPHHLVFSGVSRQGKKVESYWFNSTGWWRTHFFVDFNLTKEWFSSLSLGTKNTKTAWFVLTRMSFPDKTPFFGFWA